MDYRKFIKFIGNLPLFVFHPRAFFYRKEYIFMISHMRSRSSLLSHIIGSHPEITGYIELHRSYEDWIDMINLRRKLFLMHDKQLNSKLLFDKILHKYHPISDQVLIQENVKIIVLLRKPEETVKSIVNLGHLTDVDEYKIPEWAAQYYCERVDYLSSLIEIVNKNCFYIESDEIINHSENLLTELTKWLNLNSKLDSNYDIFNLTGKPVFGDPSDNIKSGKINLIQNSHDNINIDSKKLTAAMESYRKCHKLYTDVS